MYDKSWNPDPEILFCHEIPSFFDDKEHISVIVTNYNYENYIIECLESISNQTYNNLSLIIVDDNSDRFESIEIISDWMNKNKNRFISMKFLKNSMNQGPSASRNTAIMHSLSEIIFIIDADNTIMRTAISKLYNCLNRTNAQGVYCQIAKFGDQNQIGSADLWDTTEMFHKNYVDVMAMIKKSAWSQVGGFSHIEDGWEDYDFWLKFIDNNIDMVFLPEILCRYRVHESSRTATEAYKHHDDLAIIMRYRHPEQPKTKE